MSGSSDGCSGRRSSRRHRGRSRLITGSGFGGDGSRGKRVVSKVRTRSGWAGWRRFFLHLVFSSGACVWRGRGRTRMQVLEGLSKKRRALGRRGRVGRRWFVRLVGGERGHCDLRVSELAPNPAREIKYIMKSVRCVWTCAILETNTHLTRFCPVHQTGECLTRILSSSNRRLHRRKHVRTTTSVTSLPNRPRARRTLTGRPSTRRDTLATPRQCPARVQVGRVGWRR